MAKRNSIYLPDHIGEYLKSFGENSLSGSIATLLDRYRAITADACPELTVAEWCAICDANNGCGVWLSAGSDNYQSLWANIYDSGPEGIDQKWGISHKELAERIRVLPMAEKAAVWDVAARFWASPKLNELPTEDLLKLSGAKIKQSSKN